MVLLAREDFEALEETAYLLSWAENARRLAEALQRRPDERATFASLDDLKHAMGGRSGRPSKTLRYWIETDGWKALCILQLIEQTLRQRFSGAGKSQPLRHALAGCWSRRIDPLDHGDDLLRDARPFAGHAQHSQVQHVVRCQRLSWQVKWIGVRAMACRPGAWR